MERYGCVNISSHCVATILSSLQSGNFQTKSTSYVQSRHKNNFSEAEDFDNCQSDAQENINTCHIPSMLVARTETQDKAMETYCPRWLFFKWKIGQAGGWGLGRQKIEKIRCTIFSNFLTSPKWFLKMLILYHSLLQCDILLYHVLPNWGKILGPQKRDSTYRSQLL